MAHNDDWVPHDLPEFKIFGDNFCSEVAANKTAWGINAADAAALPGEQTTFNDDYAISSVKNKHTSLDTQATQDARTPYEARIRKIGIPMKTNDLMTDLQRTACGVVNDSDSHSLSPVAITGPAVDAERSGDLGLKIVFGRLTGGILLGQDGVSVTFGFYAIGTTKPTEANCTQTVMFKKGVNFMTFAADHFGMAFVAYARYFNTRAVLGTVATKFEGIVS